MHSYRKAYIYQSDQQLSLIHISAKSLKNPQHPYRQKIDVDFGGRVEVYTKQELLNGQNLSLIHI